MGNGDLVVVDGPTHCHSQLMLRLSWAVELGCYNCVGNSLKAGVVHTSE